MFDWGGGLRFGTGAVRCRVIRKVEIVRRSEVNKLLSFYCLPRACICGLRWFAGFPLFEGAYFPIELARATGPGRPSFVLFVSPLEVNLSERQ
jgi:hypothetical protein